MQIPVDKIIPNPEQPRRTFDADELEALAVSIRARGVIQPIVVEESPNGVYILHDGERRWRASMLADRHTVPAVVVPSLNGTGGRDRLLRALVANVQRADLNPIEIAVSLRRLRDENVWTNRKLSQETGIAYSAIPNYLKILDLNEEIQALIAGGELPKDHRVVNALLAIEDPAVRVAYAQRVARQGVTVRAIVTGAERLRSRIAETKPPTLPDAQPKPRPKTPAQPAKPPRERREQAVALSRVEDTVEPDTPAKWTNIRPAARGMCDACDVKPLTEQEPAWSLVLAAADATCKACTVADMGALDICRQCPAVDLLKRMAGVR